MYKNLEAEIIRHGNRKDEIAKELGIGYNTLILKLNGNSRLYLDEAEKIQERFFPECDLKYLFQKNDN